MPARLREPVVPAQGGQDLARAGVAGKALRHLRRHAREEGAGQQERPGVGIDLPEDLPPEVVHDLLGSAESLPVGHDAFPYGLLEHENQTGHPSVGALLEAADLFAPKRPSCMQPGDPPRFLSGQPHLLPPDDRRQPVGAQRGEHGRRSAPAHQEKVHLRGKTGRRVPDHVVQHRLRWNLLIVVEHHHRRRGEPGEQFVEEPAGEHGEAGKVFGGEEGHRLPLARGRPLRRQPHVVEERRDVRVPLVHLVPEAGKVPDVNVTADERGFPGAGRRRYPGDGPLAGVVQQPEQPLAGEIPCYLRRGDLGRKRPLFLRPPAGHHRRLSMTWPAMVSFSSSAPGPKGSSGLSYLTLLLKEYSTAPLIRHFGLKAYPAPNVA